MSPWVASRRHVHNKSINWITNKPVQNFQVQLAPFISIIEKPGEIDFKWINGGHIAIPPAGFETYFGNPPLYRFINFDGVGGMDDITEKIRSIPEGTSAEETMRLLMGDQEAFTGPAVKETMARLFQILDEDPEIDVSAGRGACSVEPSTHAPFPFLLLP